MVLASPRRNSSKTTKAAARLALDLGLQVFGAARQVGAYPELLRTVDSRMRKLDMLTGALRSSREGYFRERPRDAERLPDDERSDLSNSQLEQICRAVDAGYFQLARWLLKAAGHDPEARYASYFSSK